MTPERKARLPSPTRRERLPFPTKACTDRQLTGDVASGLEGDRLADLMDRLDGFVLRLSDTMSALPIGLRTHAMRLFYDIHVIVAGEILRCPVVSGGCLKVPETKLDILDMLHELMSREGLDVDAGRKVMRAVDDMIVRMVGLSAGLPPDVLPSFTQFALERNREMLDITAPSIPPSGK